MLPLTSGSALFLDKCISMSVADFLIIFQKVCTYTVCVFCLVIEMKTDSRSALSTKSILDIDIALQPVGGEVALGGSVSLVCSASILGSPRMALPTFLWFKDGKALVGEVLNKLIIEEASEKDTGMYVCYVADVHDKVNKVSKPAQICVVKSSQSPPIVSKSIVTGISHHTYPDIHAHAHIHTHAYIHTRTHTHTHTYTLPHTYVRAHTRTHAYAHTYTHTPVHAHIHVHTYMHTHIHTYVRAHTHIHAPARTHTHLHTHVHMDVRAHTHCTQIYRHTYIYIYIYIYVHVCLHPYIYKLLLDTI